ncbi:MAG TPA: nitronate monooxygenase, partial [Sphingopyxis sp.]|nr:nitronate monooxygenase [Sphingopyxis sp.]
MQSPICAMLGIEFPLLAFSHCRDVVVAVSKAGGMGVFGAAALPPERLEEELAWIDDHIGGKPYGVDLIVPNSFAGKGEAPASGTPAIPETHLNFAAGLLEKHGIEPGDMSAAMEARQSFGDNMREDGAAKLLEVAFRHPISLIANALGVPPPLMLELGKRNNVPVAALVGTRDHALTQVRAGVDILVVAGGEAGGHCGEVATMVLVPEVAAAVEAVG